MRSVDGLSIPAWSSGGLRQIEVAARRCVHEMDVPASLRDADGAVAPGALAILSDSTLGFAVMTTVPTPLTMATSHLHLELLRAMPSTATVLRCSGEQRSLDDHFGLAEGDIVADDGTELARATIGAVLFNGARRPARAPDEAQDTRFRTPGPYPSQNDGLAGVGAAGCSAGQHSEHGHSRDR